MSKLIVLEAAAAARDVQRAHNKKNHDAQIETFKKAGIEVVENVDTSKFKDKTFKEVSKFYIDQCGDKLIKDIDAEIAAMKNK